MIFKNINIKNINIKNINIKNIIKSKIVILDISSDFYIKYNKKYNVKNKKDNKIIFLLSFLLYSYINGIIFFLQKINKY